MVTVPTVFSISKRRRETEIARMFIQPHFLQNSSVSKSKRTQLTVEECSFPYESSHNCGWTKWDFEGIVCSTRLGSYGRLSTCMCPDRRRISLISIIASCAIGAGRTSYGAGFGEGVEECQTTFTRVAGDGWAASRLTAPSTRKAYQQAIGLRPSGAPRLRSPNFITPSTSKVGSRGRTPSSAAPPIARS